jgi:hypothetical protein
MRNFTILLCTILCFTACKKSSNKLPITASTLSGTWVRQSATTKTYSNGVLTNTSTNSSYITANAANPPDLVIYFATNLSGTYSEPSIAGIPFNYTISGDQLNLDFGNATDLPTNFTVKSLTNTQLELVDGSSSGSGMVHDITYLKNQ